MFRVALILSALVVNASGSRLADISPDVRQRGLANGMSLKRALGNGVVMGSGADAKLAFPGSLNQKNPLDMMMASKEEMEEVADHLHEDYNAGMTSFLEISSHDSFQHFGEAYMKAMEPYMVKAAKELSNKEHGLGEMFEEHLLFDVKDYEAKKVWKAFHDMDLNDDGKISKEEKTKYMAA